MDEVEEVFTANEDDIDQMHTDIVQSKGKTARQFTLDKKNILNELERLADYIDNMFEDL